MSPHSGEIGPFGHAGAAAAVPPRLAPAERLALVAVPAVHCRDAVAQRPQVLQVPFTCVEYKPLVKHARNFRMEPEMPTATAS